MVLFVCPPLRISPFRRITARQPGAFSFYFCVLFPCSLFFSFLALLLPVRRGALLLLSLLGSMAVRSLCVV